MRTTKKCVSLLLALSLFLCFSSCRSETKTITCDQVIAAYEQAGYTVFHKEYADTDTDAGKRKGVCSVCVEVSDDADRNVYFEFFETPADAKAYAEDREWNVVLWFYSLVNMDPSWVYTKTYDVIEYEYTDQTVIHPFEELISQ